MTAQLIVKPVNAAPAAAPATKLFAGRVGTWGGLCMLVGLSLLYLPAILPCVAVTAVVRFLQKR